ncbi:hypothetical protein [Bacteroides sp. 14(A)]|uniref:hypothetical protein n=1 Tax=Bacteroides sp. 14(A) TaxID=1163670 RepID=UPI0009DFFCE7|nr:hypothetical protein [Bacteroides sp. 14(A)]
MAARLTGNPQRTGKPKRRNGQPWIEIAADGTHVRTQRLATARGTRRLRVERNGATHWWAVIIRPGKGDEAKKAEGKWQNPDLSAKRRFALREWLVL